MQSNRSNRAEWQVRLAKYEKKARNPAKLERVCFFILHEERVLLEGVAKRMARSTTALIGEAIDELERGQLSTTHMEAFAKSRRRATPLNRWSQVEVAATLEPEQSAKLRALSLSYGASARVIAAWAVTLLANRYRRAERAQFR
jgi:hypothetical protein